MLVPKTPQEIQVFNGLAQFYKCFIRNFAFVMALITKLLIKIEMFEWIAKCQTIWEDIKYQYIQVPILINPNWELEFHVHNDVSQLAINDMPSNSSRDPKVGPKMKHRKKKRAGACSLTCNTSRVGRCTRVLGWVQEEFTNESSK